MCDATPYYRAGITTGMSWYALTRTIFLIYSYSIVQMIGMVTCRRQTAVFSKLLHPDMKVKTRFGFTVNFVPVIKK